MRVALISNSPWVGSGYGQQSALLLPKLVERYGPGNVAHISTWGLAGGMLTIDGVVHYPAGSAVGSDDVAPQYARHFLDGRPGIVLILYDCWMYQSPSWHGLPGLAAWVPIDHEPAPPAVLEFLTKFGVVPIAMSVRGEQLLNDAGLDASYVPLTVDTSTFTPGPADRSRFGLPDDVFVAAMVAANVGSLPIRKSFPEVFQAWRIFHERHPDSILHLHSNHTRRPGHNLDLRALASGLGVRDGSVAFTDPLVFELGLSAEDMASMYRCFDVLLSPSMGEGFGIPVIEAQACGVPVIVSDFTAQRELCINGWKVPVTPWFNPAQGAYLAQPSVEGIVDSLERAYADRASVAAAARAKAGRAHVVGNYDTAVVWEQRWMPLLDEMEAKLPRSFDVHSDAAVPAAREGILQRDLGGAVVAWSPAADAPVVLAPVAAVVLGMLDGQLSARELAADLSWALELGEDLARDVLVRELSTFERAGLLAATSAAPEAGEPTDRWSIFPGPRDPVSVKDDGSMRPDVVDLDIEGTELRVLCGHRGAAEVLRSTLVDHLIARPAPVGFALRLPQEQGAPHLLVDRSGFVLAHVSTLDEALAALGSHLAALLPPPPGTVRMRARALLTRDAAARLAIQPLLVSPPAIERWLHRASIRMVDRLVVDVTGDAMLVTRPTPWLGLAALAPAPGHASAPAKPVPIRSLLMPALGDDVSMVSRVAFLAGATCPGATRATRLAVAETMAMLPFETVPAGEPGAVYTALERASA